MSLYTSPLNPIGYGTKEATKGIYKDPGSRDLSTEQQSTLQTQADLAGQRFGLESQYRPQYDTQNLQSFNTSLFGADGQGGLYDAYQKMAPGLSALDRQTSSAARGADVADLQRYGPQAREAAKAMDPNQAALLDSLNQQTLGDVQAGYNLPSGLRNVVNQSTRSGQAARGLGYGPSDAYAETLAQSGAAQQWRNENLNRGMELAGVNTAANAPYLSILSRSTQTPGATGSLLGGGAGFGNESQMVYDRFDPSNAYAQDLYNTNYNAQAAQKIAAGNAQAGIYSSIASL